MVGAALYISGQNVPFTGEITPRITRKSYDINDPNQLWSDYTKSIEVPSNATTDALFSYLFDVNTEIQGNGFNPNRKASARIDYNDTTYIEGYCQLTGIRVADYGAVTYLVVVYGTVANMFLTLGQSKLQDLDLSALDHTWNYTNVNASWSPTLGQGYVYPMIDYGLSPSYDLWNVSQFYPAIFAKEYLDAIFAAAGYSYTSAFFESDLFKRLIIPFSGDKPQLTETQIADRIFYLSRATTAVTGSLTTSPNNVSTYDTVIFNDDSSGSNFNTSGTDYNTGTGVWSVANKGRYSFRGGMTVQLTRTNRTVNILDSPNGTNVRLKLAVVKFDGTNYTILETLVAEWDGYAAGGITPTTNSATYNFNFATQSHQLQVGDDIYLAVQGAEFYSTWSRWVQDWNFDYSIAVGAVFTINIDPFIEVGDTMLINNTIPVDIYQRDFIMGIFKMFNLFVQVDTDNPLNLIIEPYEDFFTGQDDLTAYLDTSKPFNITPMAMLQGKRYALQYKEDKDYINQKYLQSFDETFGAKLLDIDNDFLTNTVTIEPVFSPTPSSNFNGNDRVIPDMKFIDQNGAVKSGKTNIRILYWGGLKDTDKSWQIYETLPTAYTKTQYPYAGHLDDPYTPTIDLSFGVPRGLYYDVAFGTTLEKEYTNNNLHNAYWYQYLAEVTDANSKLITCYLNLADKFMDMSFRKQYYIAEAYYRLIEISDHSVDGLETTKCVFLKVNPVAAFTPTSDTWRGGEKQFPTDEYYPALLRDQYRGGSAINPSQGTTFGGGNTGGGGILTGEGNGGALAFKNVNMLGGDNNRAGADNVTLIGCENWVETDPQATIIGNLYVWRRLEIQTTGTIAAALNTTPLVVLPECGDDEYYEIDQFYTKLEYNEAFTGNATLNLQTTVTNSVWSSISTGIFNAGADATVRGTPGTHVMDFGEGLELYTNVDAGAGDTNVLTFIIYYRINRI